MMLWVEVCCSGVGNDLKRYESSLLIIWPAQTTCVVMGVRPLAAAKASDCEPEFSLRERVRSIETESCTAEKRTESKSSEAEYMQCITLTHTHKMTCHTAITHAHSQHTVLVVLYIRPYLRPLQQRRKRREHRKPAQRITVTATRAQRVGASHVTQLLAVGCRTQHLVHHVSQPVHPEKCEAVDTVKVLQRGVGGGWGGGG